MNIKQVAYSSPEFAACFNIRLTVFVDEQGVALEEEQDEYDPLGLHFLAESGGQPLGTLRVLVKDPGRIVKITRVAVLKEVRGRKIGAALMRAAEAAVPANRYILDAQVQALKFYESLGYEVFGAPFMEAGILHSHMEKLT